MIKHFTIILTIIFILNLISVPVSSAASPIDNLISVAESQIGYKEEANGWTKYGQWYGFPTGAWCAMYISWCADQAGISRKVIPAYASCDMGMDFFKDQELGDGENIGPKKTDIKVDSRSRRG